MNTRQQDIINLLALHGEITIRQLAEELNVSEMTIHRDLAVLEKEKYAYKKRGAAVYTGEQSDSHSEFYRDEKQQIGKCAASMVHPHQSILFDNSTTALIAAGYLSGIPELTFYTTNLETALVLSRFPHTILYCSGGYYFPDSKGFLGSQTEAFVEKIHADICFIGASGISLTDGITNPYPNHSSLQRKIIEHADIRILLADHSKFGKTAMEKAAELEEMDMIITDSGIRKEDLAAYGKRTEIIIAKA